MPANVLWDDETWHALNVRQVELARDAGALARLPIDLTASTVSRALGDFARAASAIAETDAVTEATQTRSRRTAPCSSPASVGGRPRPAR